MNHATVHTGRLTLSLPQHRDAQGILEIVGDPRAVEHNPSDRIADLDEASALVDRWIRHWRDRGFGYWCVRETDRSPIVGCCGMKRMMLHDQPVMNLLYRFHPDVWGRGYATEAVRAAVSWAEARCPDSVIVARVRPKNASSRRVALKADLQRDSQLDVQGEDGLDLVFSNRASRHPL